jgi:hypothetical protein
MKYHHSDELRRSSRARTFIYAPKSLQVLMKARIDARPTGHGIAGFRTDGRYSQPLAVFGRIRTGRPGYPMQRGASLLRKCFNPSCSAEFRYLHEGKLYCLSSQRAPAQNKKYERSEVEYVWMCSACSHAFQPTRNADGQISLKLLSQMIDRAGPGLPEQETRCICPQSR